SSETGEGAHSLDQLQASVQRAEHTAKIVAALQDQARCRDHAVYTLPARELRLLLEAVNGAPARAAKPRAHRLLVQIVDGVVAPFAARDLPSIDIENLREFLTAECYDVASSVTVVAAPRTL